MKKHLFVLVEVLIAIAILVTCAFPLIGAPQIIYNRQRDTLIQIELERQAELYFYSFLKEKLAEKSLEEIKRNFSEKTEYLDPLKLTIEGLGTFKYHPHYHLYHCSSKLSDPRKLWYAVCFVKNREEECNYLKKEFNYKFAFSVKTMDQKSEDLQSEEKEKSQPHNEETRTAIHSSN